VILRYVILHHTGWIEDHFDLMLACDGDGPLRTWRLDAFPNPTVIDPLPAHRRAYLDYEGPVSNHRGHVKRVAHGSYGTVRESTSVMRIILDTGQQLSVPWPAR